MDELVRQGFLSRPRLFNRGQREPTIQQELHRITSRMLPVSDGATRDVIDHGKSYDDLPIDLFAKHEGHYSTCLSFFNKLGISVPNAEAEPQTLLPRIVAFATFLSCLVPSQSIPTNRQRENPYPVTTKSRQCWISVTNPSSGTRPSYRPREAIFCTRMT